MQVFDCLHLHNSLNEFRVAECCFSRAIYSHVSDILMFTIVASSHALPLVLELKPYDWVGEKPFASLCLAQPEMKIDFQFQPNEFN